MMIVDMEHAATMTNAIPEDHRFLVRMRVHPFSAYPAPVMVPDDHHPPHPTPQNLLTAVFSSFVHDDDDDDRVAIEAEWNAIFQRWTFILERERTTVFEKGQTYCFTGVLMFLATLFFCMSLVDPDDTHGFLGGWLVPLCFLWIKDMISTNLRYSDNSINYDRNNNDSRRCAMYMENDNMENVPQHQSMKTTNQLLLQIDNMSGFATCIGCFGLWVVAIFIVTQLKEYYLSDWCYVVVFLIPMALVSFYVLKHVGGWTSLGVSYRRRDVCGRNRRERVLNKVLHEMTRHNDAWTYFTVRPQINYDFVGEIVVNIYQKSTGTSNGNDFETSVDLLSSVSNNLGMTKRRGGNDHGFIVMIDGSSELQQQQQHFDDRYDGLTTPLLTKDTSV